MRYLLIKLIGSAMLILSSFSVGYYMSKSLYRRKDFLSSFLIFLNHLATNIRYNSDDIFTLAALCADMEELDNFKSITSDRSASFTAAWNKAVLTIPKAYSLKKSDISLLKDFGSELGKTDVEGQLKHIELYKVMFKKQLADAENEITKKSKLYKTMGFFVGTAAALVMM